MRDGRARCGPTLPAVAHWPEWSGARTGERCIAQGAIPVAYFYRKLS